MSPAPTTEPVFKLSEQTIATFKDFLMKKGLRMTNQRHAILEAAVTHTQHFTAEDLLDLARAIDESVSRATVYRTLPILTESGLIREIDVGHDNKYYTATRASQNFKAQVVCHECSKIIEIDAPFMDWYGNAVSQKLGMTLMSQRLQVIASCPRYVAGKACSQ